MSRHREPAFETRDLLTVWSLKDFIPFNQNHCNPLLGFFPLWQHQTPGHGFALFLAQILLPLPIFVDQDMSELLLGDFRGTTATDYTAVMNETKADKAVISELWVITDLVS